LVDGRFLQRKTRNSNTGHKLDYFSRRAV